MGWVKTDTIKCKVFPAASQVRISAGIPTEPEALLTGKAETPQTANTSNPAEKI